MWQQFWGLMQHGGGTLAAIFAMSLIALAVGLERLVATWRSRTRLDENVGRILEHLAKGDRTMARAVNSTAASHPGSALFALVLADEPCSPGALRRAQARAVREARSFLWILATTGATAPFVGLFGTVLGVMEAFGQIAAEGSGGFLTVSAGISQALIATAGGIIVGVLAVVLFNFLQVRVGRYVAELKEAVEEVVEASQAAPRLQAPAPQPGASHGDPQPGARA